MNKEMYAEGLAFEVKEVDAKKLFCRVGRMVTMRLVVGPCSSQCKRLAYVQKVSRANAKKAVAAIERKVALAGFRAMHEVWAKYALRLVLIIGAMLLVGASFSQAPVLVAHKVAMKAESALDLEIRRMMEKGINLEERKRQVPAIAAAFAHRTEPRRARRLAALCYLKTLGTPFMPLDIAEIALAETGEFGLSGAAVSPKGAMGVWQLMPHRAKSHGYTPEEMRNDEKCAEAAVRELTIKLKMAHGDLVKAKKLYCGAGPAADAYEVKRRQFKREILKELGKLTPSKDLGQPVEVANLS